MSSGTGFHRVSHALWRSLENSQYFLRLLQVNRRGRHEPEERAAGYCGLDEKHVGVCDMAQNPVHQRVVVRDSIHTEPDNTALAREWL